jgi:hypothetical protein
MKKRMHARRFYVWRATCLADPHLPEVRGATSNGHEAQAMALLLEYAAPREERQTGWIPPAVITVLLTYAHVNLCWQLSRLMLEPMCKQIGTHHSAWTPVAWLPGCATTLWAGSGGGMAMMFLSSVLAGRLMHEVLSHYCLDATAASTFRVMGVIRDWRVWMTAVLWLAWVPVPSVLAFICQFEVWATTR